MITQKTLQLFMTNGYWKRHIRKMRKIYGKKYNTLMKSIVNHLNTNVRIIGGNAGIHGLLEIRNGVSEDTIIHKAEMVGVKIYPTSKYWIKHNDLKHLIFLMGFGALSENQIIDGIKLLGYALNNN